MRPEEAQGIPGPPDPWKRLAWYVVLGADCGLGAGDRSGSGCICLAHTDVVSQPQGVGQLAAVGGTHSSDSTECEPLE